MKLKDLLTDIAPLNVVGDLNIDISAILFDSRKVVAGSLFVAIRGTQVDGHHFIAQAIAAEAAAIMVMDEPTVEQKKSFRGTWIKVGDTQSALGRMASVWFGRPSKYLKLVGVTGTNGKTTTVTLLYDLLTEMGYKCGLISTVRNRIGNRTLPATHTTPDALAVQGLLAQMVEEGCDYAFMEVSSHAIHQKRIDGLMFSGGVFTNITHDHLDYHGTFAQYLAAKKAFFDNLPSSAFALTNLDDRNGKVMMQNTEATVYGYSFRKLTDFRGRVVENNSSGLHLAINDTEVITRLLGGFNGYNALATFGVVRLLGFEKMSVLTALSALKAADGRFDPIQVPGSKLTAIVDYAHTPDALDKVLATLDEIRTGDSQILTVVGCGGDRDKEKRPVMARVAAKWSDQVILTSDNPRSEDPEVIIKDMEKGIDGAHKYKFLSIVNRRAAIKTACRIANAGDIILVAGKGHENYQEIKGVRYPFDDKEVLKEELQV